MMEIENTNPIPKLNKVDGWKNIEIRECGEKLVPINGQFASSILVDAQYYKQNIPHASETMFTREGVLKQLLVAASYLPKGYKLLIWDAWRPLEVQKAIFDSYVKKLKEKNNVPNENLIELAQKYVSLPSQDTKKPSPHYTGGAIDLTICDQNGNQLKMGTHFDHFGPESAMCFYENSRPHSICAQNRRLLYHVMTKAGFSSYDEEWWHFDFGNQFDAAKKKEQFAIYGSPPNGGELL